MTLTWQTFAAGGLFGLLLGSFFNVAVFRLPKCAAAKMRGDGFSLLFLAWPPSFCPRCQKPIPPRRNIPLLSFVLQRGKTACCGERISWRYPFLELCGAAVVLSALWRFSSPVDAAFAIAFLSFLLVMSTIDWSRYVLPDILTLPLLWLGLLANIDARFALLPDAVLGAVAGYAGLAAFAGLCSLALQKEALGGGDLKLFAALGAWLGWAALPFVLFGAAVLGLLLAAGRWAARGRVRRVPFGPCLALAGAGFLFFGEEAAVAYWDFVLP